MAWRETGERAWLVVAARDGRPNTSIGLNEDCPGARAPGRSAPRDYLPMDRSALSGVWSEASPT